MVGDFQAICYLREPNSKNEQSNSRSAVEFEGADRLAEGERLSL